MLKENEGSWNEVKSSDGEEEALTIVGTGWEWIISNITSH